MTEPDTLPPGEELEWSTCSACGRSFTRGDWVCRHYEHIRGMGSYLAAIYHRDCDPDR